MNYSFFDFLTLLGSLGLFLYGMKLMSEGLQKLANKKLQRILGVMTTNRFTGVLTGLGITALIQSSSATTVLVVSFVNAGLLNLMQSISVIMGANIGTTVTAWIISLLGFSVDISVLSLPLLGLGIIPLMFSKNNQYKNFGEFIIGFALLFMGLAYLKGSVPDLRNNPDVLQFISRFTDLGYASYLIFLLVGTLLTIIVQSSSATIAITLIMCSKGWIPFDMGAAMVLGENIGTTITANIAALTANISARRSALAHTAFNVLGVVWVMLLFSPFVRMVTKIVSSLGSVNPYEIEQFTASLPAETLAIISDTTVPLSDPELLGLREQLLSLQSGTSYALSLFHTIFNLLNTCILIGFTKQIARFVAKVIPQKQNDEEFLLKHISTNMLSASELAIPEAKKEIDIYIVRTVRMFDMIKSLLYEKEPSAFDKIHERLMKYENISDRMDVEIVTFLNGVSEGRLSDESKASIRQMIRETSEIESIADSFYHLGNILKRKHEADISFSAHAMENIESMLSLLYDNLHLMQSICYEELVSKEAIEKVTELECRINSLRNEVRARNELHLENKAYTYQEGIFYIDFICECERLGDYLVNVVEARVGQKLPTH